MGVVVHEELFIVGGHYTAGKWWREELRPRLEGEAPPLHLKDEAEHPTMYGSAGELVASPPMPTGMELTLIAKDRYVEPPECTNAALMDLGTRVHDLLKTPEASYLEVRAGAAEEGPNGCFPRRLFNVGG